MCQVMPKVDPARRGEVAAALEARIRWYQVAQRQDVYVHTDRKGRRKALIDSDDEPAAAHWDADGEA